MLFRKTILNFIFLFFICCGLFACVSTTNSLYPMTPAEISNLQQGKRLFNEGYYRRAMCKLLPLASNGNPEAQYAVGYMYYYGYGVARDCEVGHFWIERSASKHYPPAVTALEMIACQPGPEPIIDEDPVHLKVNSHHHVTRVKKSTRHTVVHAEPILQNELGNGSK